MSSNDDEFETLADKTAAGSPAAGEPAAGDPAAGEPARSKRGGRPGPSLKARAIAILSRRENSRVELERKLAPHADDAHQLQQLLDDLERENWLSNERYALSLVNRRASRQGSRRIVQELRQHGLGDDIIARIDEDLRGTELDRAREVWQKKFATAPADAKDYARQFRFLASRGFSPDCLRRILGDLPDADPSDT